MRRRCNGARAYNRSFEFLLLLALEEMVEEHSIGRRRRVVRHAGGIGSENVGMSNEKIDEKSIRRKPKVSRGRLIRSGLVGP